MARNIREIPAEIKLGNELELYHHLVELQKEIIRLAQQNERAQQECLKLREQVVGEAAGRADARRTVRQKANAALVQLPGIATAKNNLASLIMKQPSTC